MVYYQQNEYNHWMIIHCTNDALMHRYAFLFWVKGPLNFVSKYELNRDIEITLRCEQVKQVLGHKKDMGLTT